MELTWGAMADKAIITTGVAEGDMIAPVMTLVVEGRPLRGHRGRADRARHDVQLNLFELTLQQKQLVGTIFGSANPRRDIPRLLRLYMEGKLKLDELVTRTYPLDDVNQGYQDMRDGKNIRGMLALLILSAHPRIADSGHGTDRERGRGRGRRG